jgi:hypothetical protein
LGIDTAVNEHIVTVAVISIIGFVGYTKGLDCPALYHPLCGTGRLRCNFKEVSVFRCQQTDERGQPATNSAESKTEVKLSVSSTKGSSSQGGV